MAHRDEPGDVREPEDALEAALRPGERVLWVAEADRATWRRALSWGLGCLPFTAFLAVLAGVTAVVGWFTAREALARGRLSLETGLPATVAGLLLLILVYPLVVGELSRRERRYVVTSQRALVVEPRRLAAQLELEKVALVAPHRDLFDDEATGVELRTREGTAAIVFKDLAAPDEVRSAVEAAIAAARSAPA